MADHAGQWRTIRLLLLRRIHQRDARRVRGAGRGRGEASEGFVLLFVVLATLLMTVGTLAMTNRSTMGLMGSLFQGVGIDAQEAAEIGVNRIISELNRAPNRGLLRSKGSTVETALWTLQDASSFHKSRCPGVAASDLASNANFGNASGRSTTYNTVYVQDDGSISATANGARRAYRLVSVTRQIGRAHV